MCTYEFEDVFKEDNYKTKHYFVCDKPNHNYNRHIVTNKTYYDDQMDRYTIRDINKRYLLTDLGRSLYYDARGQRGDFAKSWFGCDVFVTYGHTDTYELIFVPLDDRNPIHEYSKRELANIKRRQEKREAEERKREAEEKRIRAEEVLLESTLFAGSIDSLLEKYESKGMHIYRTGVRNIRFYLADFLDNEIKKIKEDFKQLGINIDISYSDNPVFDSHIMSLDIPEDMPCK